MTKDALQIIEEAYRAHRSDDGWLRSVVACAAPLLDAGLGVTGYTIQEFGAKLGTAHFESMSPEMIAAFEHIRRVFDSSAGQDIHQGSPCNTATRQLGHERFKQLGGIDSVRAAGGHDIMGVVVLDAGGLGFCLAVPLPEVTRLARPVRGRWSRVAAHLHAALRARHRPSPTEAILTPAGRVEHAEPSAQHALHRSRLRAGARAQERARGPLRRRDEPEALELWQALVAGRWSLVDHEESDGKRFLYAVRNDPPAPVAGALTQRETQVAFYAAMGHPLKLIGYELGLSVSTIGTHLARAMEKLGVGTRAELASVLGAAGGSKK